MLPITFTALLFTVATTTTLASPLYVNAEQQQQQQQQPPSSSSPTTSTPDPSLPLPPALEDPLTRRSFCAQISSFLATASCGNRHTPCLTLELQEEVNTKCLSWRGGRRDSLAWSANEREAESEGWSGDADDEQEEKEEGYLLEDEDGRRIIGGHRISIDMKWVWMTWVICVAAVLGYGIGLKRGIGTKVTAAAAAGHCRSPSGRLRHEGMGMLPVITEREEKGWGLW